jgi:hypothetical protein
MERFQTLMLRTPATICIDLESRLERRTVTHRIQNAPVQHQFTTDKVCLRERAWKPLTRLRKKGSTTNKIGVQGSYGKGLFLKLFIAPWEILRRVSKVLHNDIFKVTFFQRLKPRDASLPPTEIGNSPTVCQGYLLFHCQVTRAIWKGGVLSVPVLLGGDSKLFINPYNTGRMTVTYMYTFPIPVILFYPPGYPTVTIIHGPAAIC